MNFSPLISLGVVTKSLTVEGKDYRHGRARSQKLFFLRKLVQPSLKMKLAARPRFQKNLKQEAPLLKKKLRNPKMPKELPAERRAAEQGQLAEQGQPLGWQPAER